jgi:hypothetical protein
MKAAADAKEGTGRKRPKVQSRIVQKPLRLGIGCLQNLKAAIQNKAFKEVCSDAAANAVGSLQDKKIEALGLEATSTAQPGEARSHDNCIERLFIHAAFPKSDYTTSALRRDSRN